MSTKIYLGRFKLIECLLLQTPADAAVALKWYIAEVAAGRIVSNLQALSGTAARTAVLHVPDDWTEGWDGGPVNTAPAAGVRLSVLLNAAAGYDWQSPVERLSVWTRWAHLLDEKAATPEAWVASCPRQCIDAELWREGDLRAMLSSFCSRGAEAEDAA